MARALQSMRTKESLYINHVEETFFDLSKYDMTIEGNIVTVVSKRGDETCTHLSNLVYWKWIEEKAKEKK